MRKYSCLFTLYFFNFFLIDNDGKTLASFLRKSQRVLRICTLNFLSVLIRNGLTGVEQILKELPGLINDQDMNVAQLAIELAVQGLVKYLSHCN